MRQLVRWALVAASLAVAVPAWAGEVKLSFSNGRVTLVATDASPREILTEWARLGQVRVTNLDRLAGVPVTLQMTDEPEARALETILRGTAGYVAAPRLELAPMVSHYDRILLLSGTAPAITAAAASPQPSANTGIARGRGGQPSFGVPDDDGSGPSDGTAPPGIARRSGPYRPGMPAGQGPQSFVVAEPVMNDDMPQQAAPLPTSSRVPGVSVGSSSQTSGTGARPGEFVGPDLMSTWSKYGSGPQGQAPAVNPGTTPYGLPSPATKPPAQTPAGPIKVPE